MDGGGERFSPRRCSFVDGTVEKYFGTRMEKVSARRFIGNGIDGK